MAYSQTHRLLTLTTPLGEGELLLETFRGTETMSRPFEFHLDMLSENDDLAPTDIVGQAVTVEIGGEATRPFHGIVAEFARGAAADDRHRRYEAVVVPWLWLLKNKTNCRIFQNKTVPEILEQVFSDLGFSDYDLAGVQGSYEPLEYCVQYRESDFDFVSRLMEEVGIFYFFTHETSRHVLVLADSTAAYADCDESDVIYDAGSRVVNHVNAWHHRYSFVSGACAHTDYDFVAPQTSLLATASTVVELPGTAEYELYDYPGRYKAKSDGDQRIQVRMEAAEVGYDTVDGASTCQSFTLGGTFTLSQHECHSEEGKSYVLTSVEHFARDDTITAGDGSQREYKNSFRCIPDAVVYRPERLTPRALVAGPQTAVVVGPDGEEIYTDEHGRIKVQFHWDREGKKDENSSCWIRVAQSWSGKRWGAQFLPRIGQEVVIEFLEGDPDRPLVTGSVYNGDLGTPYELPANKTQTGVKSRSTKEGGPDNFNELRFEDKKGEELVYLHAEKDEQVEVENDQSMHVGGSRTEAVDGDRSLTVGGNKSESVEGAKSVTVKEDQTETVTGAMMLTVEDSRTMSVTQDLTESVDGAMDLSVGGDRSVTTSGALSETVESDVTRAVSGDENLTIDGVYNTNVAGKLLVSSDEELLLKCGDAQIKLKSNGDVIIKGGKIKLESDGEVTVKGSKIGQN